MGTTNGIHPPHLLRDFTWDDLHVEGADVATAQNQQIRDLDEKVDDIRSSVANIAVSQATTAGDVKVLATKLDGFRDTIEDRIERLETHRARDEWQAWAERLAYAIVGAGGLGVAQHFLGR